jgi:hypothetical protein
MVQWRSYYHEFYKIKKKQTNSNRKNGLHITHKIPLGTPPKGLGLINVVLYFFRFWNVNVNVFHYSFQSVPETRTFLTVQRPWPLNVPDRYHDRFWAFYERFRSFSTVSWAFPVICDLYDRFDHNNIHVNKLSSYNVL